VPYTRHFGPPSGSDPKLKDAAQRYPGYENIRVKSPMPVDNSYR
jgi:hypothetical protein